MYIVNLKRRKKVSVNKKALSLTLFLLGLLLFTSPFSYASQTPNTLYGVSSQSGYSPTILPFSSSPLIYAVFQNDYQYVSATYESSTSVYPNFWFIDGYGIYSTCDLTINSWFTSGDVFSVTAESTGQIQVYVGSLGEATSINGATELSFSSSSNVETLNVANAGIVTLAWSNPTPSPQQTTSTSSNGGLPIGTSPTSSPSQGHRLNGSGFTSDYIIAAVVIVIAIFAIYVMIVRRR